MFRRMNRPSRRQQGISASGFTVVELLTVITLMAILTVASMTSFSGVRASGFSAGVATVTESIANARLAAMANNTYVWVGINTSVVNGSSEIDIAGILSTTGQSSDLSTPGRTKALSNPVIVSSMALNSNLSMNLVPPVNDPVVQDISTSDIGRFQQNVHGSSQTFQQIIQFTPRGEASVLSAGPSRFIQIGLQYTNGTNPVPANIAVLRISGLSGEVSVYRPGQTVSAQ